MQTILLQITRPQIIKLLCSNDQNSQGWQVSTQHGNYPGNYRVITDTVEILSTLPFWVEMVET